MTASNQTYMRLPASPAFDRDGDAPVEVTRDRTRLESLGFDLAKQFTEHRFTHVVGACLQELLDLRFQLGEVEIEMFGLAQLERAAFLRARVDQLLRFEHVAAVVALIGARALEAADVAGPFDVAVGQESLRRGRIPLHGLLREQKSVFLQRQEHGLRHLEMILGVGGGEQVIGDALALEQFKEAIVIFLVHFLDRFAFFIGCQGDRRAVRIGAADHQHVIPFQAVVARDDVTGQMGAGDIPYVDFGVGIGPGNGDQNIFGHDFSFRSFQLLAFSN